MAKIASPTRALPGYLWRLISKSALRYNDIDGEQRSASFAYYAFFSLFPLLVLLVTVVGGSLLKNQEVAARTVTQLLEQYIPLSPEDQAAIVKTLDGVLEGRGSAGLLAVLTLAWSSLRFFQALLQGVNRAWGTKEYAWWHLPLKNLAMVALLASGMVLGGILPTVLAVVRKVLPEESQFVPLVFNVALSAIPLIILFYVLLLFYKYAPRTSITFREIWPYALSITLLLKVVQFLFGIYLRSYSNFNLIYGAFAGVMALLLWIYLSGSLVIFGGCLCAVGRELRHEALSKRSK